MFSAGESDGGRSSESAEEDNKSYSAGVRGWHSGSENTEERRNANVCFDVCVGWSGLLFRTRAGMVNTQGFSNRRLWSQRCREMMLMSQMCQKAKGHRHMTEHQIQTDDFKKKMYIMTTYKWKNFFNFLTIKETERVILPGSNYQVIPLSLVWRVEMILTVNTAETQKAIFHWKWKIIKVLLPRKQEAYFSSWWLYSVCV